ncbi:type VII secretion target [Nocardia fusca]|uniref:type VII secretion target n=1 Tax=Nocardia fusca TaxID=941183 RepID=UPI0007A742AC|nr:type VII secretion target [Nocardia fusca]
MATPSQQAITVAIGAVRGAATSWDEAAAALEEARLATEKTKFEQLEAGVFILAYEKYKGVPDFFADRMKEGIAVFNEIAATLRQVADTYEAEDAQNAHALNNLY